MEHAEEIPMRRLLLRIGLRFILIVMLLLFVVLLLPRLLDLFLPFVLAFFAAALLTPLVGKLSKRKGKIWNFWSMLFVLLLIILITGVLVYLGYYLFTQIRDLVLGWESIQSTYMGMLDSLSQFLERHAPVTSSEVEAYVFDALQNALDWIAEQISSWAPNMFSSVGNLASGIASFLISLIFFIVGAYFMTADYHRIFEKVSSHIPDIIRPQMRQIRAAAGSAMFGYLKAQLILSGVVTIIVAIALSIYGQSYALLIALVCGIIDIIPFFGSGTILVPWALISIIMSDYHKAIFLLILALILFLFRKVAEPKVVGNQTGLSPLMSLISIYVGIKLGGVLGMILVPILCMIIISLYGVGFFDPTIQDFRILVYRVRQESSLKGYNVPPLRQTKTKKTEQENQK